MKLPYAEGDVFVLPLPGGGFARGIVARSAPKGKVLYGYFYGPRLARATDAKLDDLMPTNAMYRGQFGDLGLYKKKWCVIGRVPSWKREHWGMTPFAMRSAGLRPPRLVVRSDSDLTVIVSVTQTDVADDVPDDILSGSGAIETTLEILLSGRTLPSSDAEPHAR